LPGNLRRKLKHGGPTERDYLRMRRQVLRESSICAICFDAVDQTLVPICCKVDTRGYTVEDAHKIPTVCGPECKHQKKANPFSPSLDHIIPVDQLPPGSPLLTSRKNGQVAHLVCNQKKSNRDGVERREKFVSSGDWFS
jgi:hypothetical protein